MKKCQQSLHIIKIKLNSSDKPSYKLLSYKLLVKLCYIVSSLPTPQWGFSVADYMTNHAYF